MIVIIHMQHGVDDALQCSTNLIPKCADNHRDAPNGHKGFARKACGGVSGRDDPQLWEYRDTCISYSIFFYLVPSSMRVQSYSFVQLLYNSGQPIVQEPPLLCTYHTKVFAWAVKLGAATTSASQGQQGDGNTLQGCNCNQRQLHIG